MCYSGGTTVVVRARQCGRWGQKSQCQSDVMGERFGEALLALKIGKGVTN